MSLKYMTKGTRVEVKSQIESTPYFTTVQDVMDGGRILLDIMRLGGEETRLSENKPYVLRFFSDRGVFKFTAVLRGFVRKGHYDYMLFKTSDDGEKIQRRQSFRLACGEEVEFSIVDGEQVGEPQKGFVRDISSGGVRMLCKDDVDASQLIKISLPMIAPNFTLFAAILSKQEISEDAKYMWQYGIEFIGATNADMEKIVMYVHSEQQKARARK